jgi:L-ribulose-5-phosphate 3-epimerase
MRLGYNTNGFAHHRIEDALAILASIGYGSVAITLDHHVLNPFAPDLARQIDQVRGLLDRHGLSSVIETGGRFLLDPWRKHQPTLVSPTAEERAIRVGFLERAIDIAAALGSDALSFWSGSVLDDASPDAAMDRLVAGCRGVLERAGLHGMRLAFEPEPGMFVDRMARYAELADRLRHPLFGLTMDIGHVHCLGDGALPEVIERWREWLWNIHVEDMRRGVHEHLMFGEGEIDFLPVFRALERIHYAGGFHVELSRHSYDAVRVARESFRWLSQHSRGAGGNETTVVR